VFQHPDTLWSGMLRSQHQHENRGRDAGACPFGAPLKARLPVPVKRVESGSPRDPSGDPRFSSTSSGVTPIITMCDARIATRFRTSTRRHPPVCSRADVEIGASPTESVRMLEHEHSLRAALDPAWAVSAS